MYDWRRIFVITYVSPADSVGGECQYAAAGLMSAIKDTDITVVEWVQTERGGPNDLIPETELDRYLENIRQRARSKRARAWITNDILDELGRKSEIRHTNVWRILDLRRRSSRMT